MTYTTEQKAFWQGDFGNDYTDRSCSCKTVLVLE